MRTEPTRSVTLLPVLLAAFLAACDDGTSGPGPAAAADTGGPDRADTGQAGTGGGDTGTLPPDGGQPDAATADAVADTGTPEGDASGPSFPYIALTPGDGATDVPLDQPVVATVVNEEDAEELCEFTRDATTFTVEGPEGPVAGRLYFYNTLAFPTTRRVDFHPEEFYLPETTYTVRVGIPCAGEAMARFTTAAAGGDSALRLGDSMEVVVGQVRHPPSLGGILGSFLNEARVLIQVTALEESGGAGTVEFFGGQSEVFGAGPVLVFDDRVGDVAMFMAGDLLWPYFRAVGSLTVQVRDRTRLTIQHFELGGVFRETDGGVAIENGYLVGVARCEEICRAVAEVAGEEFNCEGIRPSVCDDQDNLNLMGSFTGEPNDLSSVQVITLTPAPGTRGVAHDTPIVAAFTRAVDTANPRAVRFTLEDGAGRPLEGTVEVAADGLGATFRPAAPLAPGAYTASVVALAAARATFTVGE